jgi:glyoxylate reductase
MGGIGQRTAEMAHNAFGMPVLYYSRSRKADAPDWAQYEPDLSTFLGKVDVLSIHIALKPETEGYLGAREFAMMKRGSIIINTARGKVIDEDALIGALRSGQVSPNFLASRLAPC